MKRYASISTMFFILIFSMPALGGEVIVAAGAGYRKMVTEIADYCKESKGLNIQMSFGNLGQILAQAKLSDKIPIVIGDKGFFQRAGVAFAETISLGSGKLVLAWRQGIVISSVDEITTGKVRRIAIPNLEKAIYGRAGHQFLESSGLLDAIKDKLMMVATVPQVNSYLVTGEVDAGFGNLTDVMGIADKIGGYLVIEDGYQPIEIISGVFQGHAGDPGVKPFNACLRAPEVAEIAKKHGL